MPDPLLALKYDALTRQLERMRAMQYGYFTKFFAGLLLNGFAFVAIYLLPFTAAHVLLPFWVLTAGVQSSFYLHFVDFARVHAAALEKRINALLGEELLVGGRLEEVYFYPLERPKFSGIILTHPSTFFSAFTVHWLFVWGFFFLVGLYRAWQGLGPYLALYLALLGMWSAVNALYLAWYFIGQRDEKRIAKLLREVYGSTA